jgi:hypothetical protein
LKNTTNRRNYSGSRRANVAFNSASGSVAAIERRIEESPFSPIILSKRSPPLVFFEIFGDVFGEKNVPSVATIHHPFGGVDSSAREIGPFVYIHNPANGSAVDSHPKAQARIFP